MTIAKVKIFFPDDGRFLLKINKMLLLFNLYTQAGSLQVHWADIVDKVQQVLTVPGSHDLGTIVPCGQYLPYGHKVPIDSFTVG